MAGVRMQSDVFEINLLQEPQRRIGVSVAAALITALFLAGVLAPLWLWHDANRQMEASLSQLSGLDRQLLELQAQHERVSDARSAEALLAAVGDLRLFRPRAGGMMGGLNRLLPPEANLNGLVYADGHVQLTLDFASMEHIITFLNEIEKSDSFALVSFGSMNSKDVPGQAGVPAGLPWAGFPDAADPFVPLFGEPDFPAASTGASVAAGEASDILPVIGVVFELAHLPGNGDETAEREGQLQ